uniref:Uncharacterized protein n=1 Tax=viral metagenome TaxID=1070528 RepID=A0A6M3LD70_9ZZZZ
MDGDHDWKTVLMAAHAGAREQRRRAERYEVALMLIAELEAGLPSQFAEAVVGGAPAERHYLEWLKKVDPGRTPPTEGTGE